MSDDDFALYNTTYGNWTIKLNGSTDRGERNLDSNYTYDGCNICKYTYVLLAAFAMDIAQNDMIFIYFTGIVDMNRECKIGRAVLINVDISDFARSNRYVERCGIVRLYI